jgi:hypothetical protein
LRNWRFLGCFSSRETNRGVGQAVINSGGLILVLASGPSACPKNVRDLTVSCIHFKHHEIIKVIPNLGEKKSHITSAGTHPGIASSESQNTCF